MKKRANARLHRQPQKRARHTARRQAKKRLEAVGKYPGAQANALI